MQVIVTIQMKQLPFWMNPTFQESTVDHHQLVLSFISMGLLIDLYRLVNANRQWLKLI
jgi:hypothetical protein